MPSDFPYLTRREAIAGLATASGALALGPQLAAAQGAAPPPACVLTPEAIAGPFYFDPKLVRADITDGRPGSPMRLMLRLQEAGPCTPIAGARIDVWHADAGGSYSGYPDQPDHNNHISTVGQSFLRGTQLTDAEGKVEFRSIYPGWYPGRTPHIHIKVFLDARDVATTQLYFADEVSDRIFAKPPYNIRRRRDTTNRNDGILRHTRNSAAVIAATREDGDTLVASLTIGIKRQAPQHSNPIPAPVPR